jgi:NADPH2:quinone reductase
MDVRLHVWRRLASLASPAAIRKVAHAIELAGLPDAFDALLKGAARGRFVVNVAAVT